APPLLASFPTRRSSDLGGGGVRAVAAISEQVPSSAIVMFADTLNEEELFDALRAGATGYILKDADPARLPFVLRGVLAGEAALRSEEHTSELQSLRHLV